MNQKLISAVSKEIYHRFPEFAGTQPKVQIQHAINSRPSDNGSTYLLTFNSQASIAGKKSLPRWVRVVVNEQGKILKVSTSR